MSAINRQYVAAYYQGQRAAEKGWERSNPYINTISSMYWYMGYDGIDYTTVDRPGELCIVYMEDWRGEFSHYYQRDDGDVSWPPKQALQNWMISNRIWCAYPRGRVVFLKNRQLGPNVQVDATEFDRVKRSSVLVHGVVE